MRTRRALATCCSLSALSSSRARACAGACAAAVAPLLLLLPPRFSFAAAGAMLQGSASH
jgi:hypothetical protein